MAQPPIFAPDNKEDILAFFQQYKYAVVADALPPADIRTLNAFVDRSKGEIPREWGPDRLGVFSARANLGSSPRVGSLYPAGDLL